MKIQSPWMGRIKGSAGNMTGCKVYDKNVMRAKAFEVSNPNTAAQQNQRYFFKQVSNCVSSLSSEELRSLFGEKPKSMSRRNALSKQVSSAYSFVGTTKTLDFSKLLSIGNGETMNTPYAQVNDGLTEEEFVITRQSLNVEEGKDPNLIIVFFDSEKNSIELINTNTYAGEINTYMNMAEDYLVNKNGYFYVTCASDGSNVYGRSFGGFIIKTRKEKIGR